MAQTRAVSSVQINGPALRAIRELTGMSCSALARAVGIDVSFLARVERGEKRGVGRATFERLVVELHVVDRRALLVDPYSNAVTGNMSPKWPHGGPMVVSSICRTCKAA